jgi:hypothetical protein
MTREKKLQDYIRRNVSEKPTVRTEDGLDALEELAKLARRTGIRYAIAGGIAMHLYGFTRATTGVDVVADDVLDIDPERELSFGGESYLVRVGKRDIPVDWIVRDDDYAEWYAKALDASMDSGVGHPIIAPEWMVALKFFAGRGKDHLDLLWLLRQEGLVDRDDVRRIIVEVMGKKYAAVPLRDLDALFLEADVMRQRDDVDEGSRPPRKRAR